MSLSCRAASSSGMTTGGPSSESVPCETPVTVPPAGAWESRSRPDRSVNSQPLSFAVGRSSSDASAAPFRRRSASHSGSVVAAGAAGPLANRALHLQLDEAVHLDRVLHRKLLRDGLDEAVHDHLRGLLL